MEEYAENAEESIQKVQSGAEQETEETMKINRGVEEADIEQGQKGEVSEFVSSSALVSWEKSLNEKDFIGERGFNKLISPFIKVNENRGRELLCENKALGFVVVEKEFFVNMVEVREKTIYVRGEWITFSREQINEMFNLKEKKDGSKFKKLVKGTENNKIVDLFTYGKGKWKSTKKTPYESITRGSLIEEANVWFYFVSSALFPSKHLSTVRKKEAILLYALLKGYKFSVGKLIENSILGYYRSKYKGLIPHPTLITRLCILGGVKGD